MSDKVLFDLPSSLFLRAVCRAYSDVNSLLPHLKNMARFARLVLFHSLLCLDEDTVAAPSLFITSISTVAACDPDPGLLHILSSEARGANLQAYRLDAYGHQQRLPSPPARDPHDHRNAMALYSTVLCRPHLIPVLSYADHEKAPRHS